MENGESIHAAIDDLRDRLQKLEQKVVGYEIPVETPPEDDQNVRSQDEEG